MKMQAEEEAETAEKAESAPRFFSLTMLQGFIEIDPG